MHRLLLRFHAGRWEVQVPTEHHAEWIQCDSMQDAHTMALSESLAFDAVGRVRTGEDFAQELVEAARLFLAYNCHERAIWLAEHAKVARGEPSIFDSTNPGDQ